MRRAWGPAVGAEGAGAAGRAGELVVDWMEKEVRLEDVGVAKGEGEARRGEVMVAMIKDDGWERELQSAERRRSKYESYLDSAY